MGINTADMVKNFNRNTYMCNMTAAVQPLTVELDSPRHLPIVGKQQTALLSHMNGGVYLHSEKQHYWVYDDANEKTHWIWSDLIIIF